MNSNLPHLDRLIRLGSLVAAVGIGGGPLEQRLETRRQHRKCNNWNESGKPLSVVPWIFRGKRA